MCILNTHTLHACQSLEFVHARGLVHGDVKPENIVAAANPSPDEEEEGGEEEDSQGPAGDATPFYLVDFGGATTNNTAGRAGSTGSSSTDSCYRSLWCTPSYASVSVLRGGRPAPRDDAESLCCVMLWLATGQLPW
jgi:serine/threonine protein kinase